MLKRITLGQFKKRGTLVLGGFDGVHIGHRRLIERAKEQGLPVGITTIVGGKGECLFTEEERLSIFRALGVDFVAVMRFDDIKDYSPRAFLTRLEEEFVPSAYVCGDDFRFGKGASGDASTIATMTKVPVAVERLVRVDGQKVSTSSLKDLLSAGETEKIKELLGFSFFATAEVERGRKVGRTLGFPTANLSYPRGKTPLKEGVYAIRSRVDGKEYKGIANFGAQPTFGQNSIKLEGYLDGFDGDLYGKKLTLSFEKYLRPVTAFSSAEELKEQLQKDIRKVREDD